jgi:hypothetical protein
MTAEVVATLTSTVLIVVAVIGSHLQTNGRLDQLAVRIDTLGARLDARIDSLGKTFTRHDHGTRP